MCVQELTFLLFLDHLKIRRISYIKSSNRRPVKIFLLYIVFFICQKTDETPIEVLSEVFPREIKKALIDCSKEGLNIKTMR